MNVAGLPNRFHETLLRVGLCLLFLLPAVALAGNASGQIRSVGISPDGKLVAVAFQKGSSSFIYEIDVASGKATRLTDAATGVESGPGFSPDGERIVFTYRQPGGPHSEIVLVNIDGSGLQRWAPTGVNAFYPVLSPDTKSMVFGRSGFYGSYSPIAQPHLHAWRFYVSDLDGTNLRELTNESFYAATAPSVSPDGKTMALMTIGIDTPQQIAIYSLDHPGKPLLALRPHVPREADHKEPIVDYPNYLPDGKSILFMAASNGKPWSGFDYDIYRVEIGTGIVERLTKGNGYASDLKVSANGKIAVFLKWHSDWRGTPVRSEPYLLDVPSHKLSPLKISGLN